MIGISNKQQRQAASWHKMLINAGSRCNFNNIILHNCIQETTKRDINVILSKLHVYTTKLNLIICSNKRNNIY